MGFWSASAETLFEFPIRRAYDRHATDTLAQQGLGHYASSTLDSAGLTCSFRASRWRRVFDCGSRSCRYSTISTHL